MRRTENRERGGEEGKGGILVCETAPAASNWGGGSTRGGGGRRKRSLIGREARAAVSVVHAVGGADTGAEEDGEGRGLEGWHGFFVNDEACRL